MAKEEQDALDAMSSEFVAEIKDDLASLETDLLAMEKKGADADDDLINHAFRSIHSIKGGAGFLNFQELSGLSHVMESVLMQIREKKISISSDIVDSLLSGFDKMKLMVELMGKKDEPCDYSEEQGSLKKILERPTEEAFNEQTAATPLGQAEESKVSSSSPQAPTTAPDSQVTSQNDAISDLKSLKPVSSNGYFKNKKFPVETDRLDNALKSQKYLYAVCFAPKKDLIEKEKNLASVTEDIKSIGDILYTDGDLTPETEAFYFVVATILDFPLLIQVLEIDKGQLTLMDEQFTDVQTILNSLQTPSASTAEKKQETPESATPPPATDTVSVGEDSPSSPVKEPQLSAASSQTIRINVDLISRLMNRAGELVLSRNQLRPLLEESVAKNKTTSHVMQNLDMVTTDIQEAIMQMRMQPVIDLLGKYKRVVRDIARRISKKVELVLEGGDVEVDRNVLEKLANPVTHLIRNCIDHGIETPEIRTQKGKPETGTIKIKAFHQGGHVHLSIAEDGAGIDPQMVLSKAFEKGLVTEEQLDQLTDKQKVNLIFLPGFSTSEQITDISGRGVGMDVVKTNIERLRGRIEIESVKGKGTRVHLIIPLTLAIVPSLIVSTGSEKFAIPPR